MTNQINQHVNRSLATNNFTKLPRKENLNTQREPEASTKKVGAKNQKNETPFGSRYEKYHPWHRHF